MMKCVVAHTTDNIEKWKLFCGTSLFLNIQKSVTLQRAVTINQQTKLTLPFDVLFVIAERAERRIG